VFRRGAAIQLALGHARDTGGRTETAAPITAVVTALFDKLLRRA
jgi:hypothetical protein